MRPKHHWAMDLSAQMARDKVALDARVVERQRLMVKRVAQHARNTTCYEATVVSGILHIQLREAAALHRRDCLHGPLRPLRDLPGVSVTHKAYIHGATVGVDEVVMKGQDAAVVAACATDGTGLFLFVVPMVKLADITSHSGRFRRTTELAVWEALDVQQVLAWKDQADASVLIIYR